MSFSLSTRLSCWHLNSPEKPSLLPSRQVLSSPTLFHNLLSYISSSTVGEERHPAGLNMGNQAKRRLRRRGEGKGMDLRWTQGGFSYMYCSKGNGCECGRENKRCGTVHVSCGCRVGGEGDSFGSGDSFICHLPDLMEGDAATKGMGFNMGSAGIEGI